MVLNKSPSNFLDCLMVVNWFAANGNDFFKIDVFPMADSLAYKAQLVISLVLFGTGMLGAGFRVCMGCRRSISRISLCH